MNEEKTVLEVLKETVTMLGNLRIPMSEMESIGFPISRSINNIRLCVEAIERNEVKQAEPVNTEPSEDDIVVEGEVVPKEEV